MAQPVNPPGACAGYGAGAPPPPPVAPNPLRTPGSDLELGAWRGENVNVGQVLEALADLRRGEQRSATRTCVVNLVVRAGDDDQAGRACAALHRLGGRHPGRTVVVVGPRGGGAEGPSSIDAEVRLHGTEAEGHAVWSEDVRLRVRGPLLGHLDSIVEPLTLPDLPVVAWFVGRPPDPSDALLLAADAVIVDAKTEEPGGEKSIPAVVTLGRRNVVIDLSWIRLRPWRELMGGLFDGPILRPFLDGVTRAEVRGKPGPRLLLAGWLSSRLGLSRSQLQLVDSRHTSMRLTAESDGATASFVVDRKEGDRTVFARAEVEGGATQEDRLSLAEDSLSWSLAHALTHLRHDRVHSQAVHAALGLGE
ncbi:MAG TPA: glucose-6-phosphate dehydrogenase assembly protein OpcA [Acidimicrobiales bacterium]|nr:glucose-6-phosphate dehydrogenase assembly protein OpcA [Acidimicrobiales bacterium]